MARKKRNSKPSFVEDTLDTFVPTSFMERTAKGIAGDLQRVKGKLMGQRNPDMEALGARLAMGAVVPGGVVALTALEVAEAVNAGMLDDAVGVLVKPMETVASIANPRKRRNPEDSAALAFKIFHGKPPDGTTEILEEIHEHENLWALGSLQEIVIEPVSLPGRQATFEFQDDNPWLCGNEPTETSGGIFEPSQMVCTQLYVRGGDQGLDLDGIKMGKGTQWYREHMCLGYLVELTYHTQKGFDSFKPVDYYHALGEETGEVPMVCYDTRNKLITIQGGQYEIKAQGICN